MLTIDEDGVVSHLNPAMPTVVKVPHRRQVLAALRGLHKVTKTRGIAVNKDLDTICHFFGITLDQLIEGDSTTH